MPRSVHSEIFLIKARTEEESDMSGFGIRFLICNLFIMLFISILTCAKRLLRGRITEQAQYAMDFSFLALFIIPFLPLQSPDFPNILSGLNSRSEAVVSGTAEGISRMGASVGSTWIRDFAVSVDSQTSSTAGMVLIAVWLLGAAVTGILVFLAYRRLRRIERSALPLENPDACRIFRQCCGELGIKRDVSVYTTLYLKSPVMTGIFRPRVLLPLDVALCSDGHTLRCILLHELNHYIHKDASANLLMNLAGIVYWFNPLVWYALRQMRNDRETACDSGVLELLDQNERTGYGHTLISFAEKFTLFPFTSGIGSSMKQLEKRIRNIASYRTASPIVRVRGAAACILSVALVVSFVPFLPSFAGTDDHYDIETDEKTVEQIDLSDLFGSYGGSFVLYDAGSDIWKIYNETEAGTRVSPDSTYKVYDALMALESGIITPESSSLTWDGTAYSFDAWNSDQDLTTAIQSSVNWYFQSLDRQAGRDTVADFYDSIEYGNRNTSGDISSYWMESTLKISPVEQVELLAELYYNGFGFSQKNIDAVKDSLKLSSGQTGTLSGKTGTGMVDGKNVNGWFIGYVEQAENVYFFAANIQGEEGATGSAASDLVLSVLRSYGIWNE